MTNKWFLRLAGVMPIAAMALLGAVPRGGGATPGLKIAPPHPVLPVQTSIGPTQPVAQPVSQPVSRPADRPATTDAQPIAQPPGAVTPVHGVAPVPPRSQPVPVHRTEKQPPPRA